MTPNEYKEKLAALNAEFYGDSSSHAGGGMYQTEINKISDVYL